MPKPLLTQKVTLPQDVLRQDLAGEAVLLNLNTEEYFGLDEVGTRMLEVLTEEVSIESARDRLLTEYDVALELLQRDLLDFVEQLAEQGLVKLTTA